MDVDVLYIVEVGRPGVSSEMIPGCIIPSLTVVPGARLVGGCGGREGRSTWEPAGVCRMEGRS